MAKVDPKLFKGLTEGVGKLARRVTELENRQSRTHQELDNLRRRIYNATPVTCHICGRLGVKEDMSFLRPLICADQRYVHSTCREGTKFDRRKTTRGEEKT